MSSLPLGWTILPITNGVEPYDGLSAGNGDEIYYHHYPALKAQTTAANTNDSSGNISSYSNLAENSANSVGSSASSSYILQDQPVETTVQSYDSSENVVSNWHLADNSANGGSSTASSSYTQQVNRIWFGFLRRGIIFTANQTVDAWIRIEHFKLPGNRLMIWG